MSVELEHDRKCRYEGAGYYSLDLSITHPGGVFATWITYEGKLDAPDRIPAGSMLSKPDLCVDTFRAIQNTTIRGDNGRKWVTDPYSGQRICVPWDFDFEASIRECP